MIEEWMKFWESIERGIEVISVWSRGEGAGDCGCIEGGVE